MGCSLYSEREPWHFAQTIPRLSIQVDIVYLKALIHNGFQGYNTTCTYVGHSMERRTYCSMRGVYCTYAQYILFCNAYANDM